MSAEPELAGAFDRAKRAAVEKFALGWADRLRPQPQYWRDTSRVWSFAERYVSIAFKRKQERKQSAHKAAPSEEKQANFLDEITERTDNPDEIHKGALHLLVAGRDSTASLLSNLWFTLARDERVWLKLKQEVDGLRGTVPNAGAVRQMPYLRACINECELFPMYNFSGHSADHFQKRFVATLPFPGACVPQDETRLCLSAEDPTANPPSHCQREQPS